MNSLYYFNPLSFSQFPINQDIANWSKIYKLINFAVGMNDRTGTLKQPVRQSIYAKCELPALDPSFNLSYSDCCDKRAAELYELSVTTGKPLGVMWSGGIDSTMILVSFLRNYSINDLKSRVKVIISSESKIENPEFYKNFVLPNFEFVNSEHTPWLMDGSMIIVTGEFNDQLFGSDMMKTFISKRGAHMLSSPYNRDTMYSYLNSSINDPNVTNTMINAVINSSNVYGIKLDKISDFFWWYNFCFKWQNVYFRMYSLMSPRNFHNLNTEFDSVYMQHFYHSDYFQLWSITHPEVRIIMDWKEYKMEAKTEIYKFDKNEEYYVNKIKRGSLYTVFGQRPLLDGIDSDFNPIATIDPTIWYNPDNFFKY